MRRRRRRPAAMISRGGRPSATFQRKLMEGGGGPPGTSPFSTPGGSSTAGPRRGCTAGLARGRPAPGREATPTFVGCSHMPGGTALWGVPEVCTSNGEGGPAPPCAPELSSPKGEIARQRGTELEYPPPACKQPALELDGDQYVAREYLI